MAYIVEQKIKGRVYLYEVTNHWDKTKKQPRQKRKYIGPKERVYKKRGSGTAKHVNKKPSNMVSKSVGDTYFLSCIQNEIGLTDLLKQEFGSQYKEILSVSNYMLGESSASYLYPYWHDEHHMTGVKKLNSQGLSELYSHIGRHERERYNFIKSWAKHLNPNAGIYYDISSISSYSTHIETIEWGYNRDKENLPQMNIGMIHCNKTSLPVTYTVYPGSIVDVTTLKSTIKRCYLFELNDLFLVLDRGFCSVANIMEMYHNGLSFVQPLSHGMKKTKEFIAKNKVRLQASQNAFKFRGDILYHVCDTIEFEGVQFEGHVFYNEKAAIDYTHFLYSVLFELDSKVEAQKPFKTVKDYDAFLCDGIPQKYKRFYKLDNESMTMVKDESSIEDAILKAGTFVMIHYGTPLTKHAILDVYRNRDAVEKDIHALKNHMDGKRLRAHNQDTANGRLFVKFISLITYAKLKTVIKSHKLLSNYSINEIIAELKKLKANSFDEKNVFLTELSKKQKMIFEAFGIDFKTINPNNSY